MNSLSATRSLPRPTRASATGWPMSAVPAQRGSEPRVCVLDGDPRAGGGVRTLLQECLDVQIVGACTDRPEVVVLVIERVGPATGSSLRDLARHTDARVLVVVTVLDSRLDTERAAEVILAGAMGIVRRDETSRSELRWLIHSIVAGQVVLPADILATLLGRPAPARGHRLSLVGLTDREIKVLRLLSDGSDTREISNTLCYSERTVKSIIQEITRRFGLRNRSHAVAFAMRHGLI